MKQKSLDQKIQESVFTDKAIDRDTLKKLLVQDMRSCLVFMNEIMAIPEAVDALVDVYYGRYVKFHEEKNKVPDPSDVPDSLKEEVDPGQIKMFEQNV